jgi:hypothetical protein
MSTSEVEAYEATTGDRTRRSYWYHTTRVECVLCGRGPTYRERRYTPRPTDPNERWDYRDDVCGSHFI